MELSQKVTCSFRSVYHLSPLVAPAPADMSALLQHRVVPAATPCSLSILWRTRLLNSTHC